MDRISKERRSKNMSRIRSRNTSLEISVRRFLYERGYRYRLHFNIEGKPDVVFVKKRIAIFVNGCFWHLHGCSLSRIPTTRSEFWEKKLKSNKERDERVKSALEYEGWRVLTLWECEIMDDLSRTMSSLLELLT